MAMASTGNGLGEEEVEQIAAELSKSLKEGERILAPTRRPDGTLRKPIRIRAGYVPQDEVAIYQSKGALWKKEMASQEVPGYYPDLDAKAKTKSAKRNERKKEKRQQQASLDKGKNLEKNEVSSAEDGSREMEFVESVASQINELSISAIVNLPSNSTECLTPGDPVPDIDKRIRALKKKIRLTEAQQQKNVQQDMNPEQLDKVAKLEGWRKELQLLEDKRAELTAS
ncbi:hypothetical protein F0562_028999 [Nyssa sinensis]|uniref:WIBG Mago-binding domain-containing protein n=1 Tax=Nyssa sinensis TaxID=561372 RepID=A0A5J5B5U9_9ASTE|nr:hypothetical protein F0562_028999 [Nyssa sinensis]